MSGEVTFIDYTGLERKAGRKAARTLKRDFESVLRNSSLNIQEGFIFKKPTELFTNTSVKTVMKFDALDHLSIATPHYIFKQHYGFEGIKSNGSAMSMKPYNHFTKLFKKTSALKRLADEVGNIRADEITSKIIF